MIKSSTRRLYLEKFKPAYESFIKLYPFTLDDLDGEIWRPIPDYEEFYHCSNFGRVKSFYGKKLRIMRPVLGLGGYLQINLFKNGVSKTFCIHALVARLFLLNPNNLPQVNHIDGNKFNNFVGNFEWITAAENQRHAFAIGLQKAGSQDSQAIFSEEQVKYIRENPDGLNLQQLAEKFKTTKKTISRVQTGEAYKNVPGQLRAKSQGGSPPVPDDEKARILADYKPGVSGCGTHALAKKYGRSQSTILKIVRCKL